MVKQTRVYVLGIAFVVSLCGLGGVVASLRAQTGVMPPTVIDDVGAAFSAPGYGRSMNPNTYGGMTSWSKQSNAATWTFTGLGNGTYDVYATWYGTSSFTTKALYRAAADSSVEKEMNQSQPPTGNLNGGKWEKIGSVTTSNGKITVTVKNNKLCAAAAGNNMPNCYVQADAVAVVLTQAGVNGAICGDGQIQEGEECDDGNTAFNDACTSACKNARCGDGIVRAGVEQCDDGNQSQDDACTNACAIPACGDGIKHPAMGEVCDDGNTVSTDSCTAECKPARCGDGYAQPGEQCDYAAPGSGLTCSARCTLAVCGDRIVEAGEYCDDGNTQNGDGCSAQCVTEAPADAETQTLSSVVLSCEGLVPYATVTYSKNYESCTYMKKADGSYANSMQFFCAPAGPAAVVKKIDMRQGISLIAGEKVRLCHPMIMAPWACSPEVTVTGTECTEASVCGNGVKQPGEECDDGNQSNTDGCLNTCKPATCGDGFLRPNYEGCDDGNRDDSDFCSNTCGTQRCGDGITQGNRGENCDDMNLNNGDTCTNTCKTAVCGDGHVKIGIEFCDDGNTVSGDGCSATCHTEIIHVCGNGIKTGIEQCDDGNTRNGDGCSSTCQVQQIPPVGCGNAVVDNGEICDNGAQNGPSPLQCSLYCRWNMINVCGNGLKEGIEQCDDGNTLDTDACTKYCRTGGVCGNNVKDPGEECDDGANVNNDACTAQCKNATCGDSITWAGKEQCDDGNTRDGDGCSSTCQVAPVCGNGITQTGEQCDDGNQVNTDACTTLCKSAACGDGHKQGSEQCDDGNTIDTDACRNNCTLRGSTTVPTPPPAPQIPASCGNWIFDAGEQCDMGGVRTPIPNNTSMCCTAACRVEACGGTVTPSCGDGIVQSGEQCDDGNTANGDACNSTCTAVTTTAQAAALSIQNIEIPPSTQGLVTSASLPAVRFTATAGNRNVTINNLQFVAQQGNIQRGFWVVLKETRPGDNPDAFYEGRYWYGTLQNGKFVVSSAVSIPANTTKNFDLELYTQHDYVNGQSVAAFNPQLGPVQLTFDTATPNYVRASTVTNGVTTQLANVATNGACGAASCAIAVRTGPTIVHTFRNGGNLTVTGEAGASAQNIKAGTESPVLMRLNMRMTYEDAALYVLPFKVQGGQAVQELALKIDGVAVAPAILMPCSYLAPYSQQERDTQGSGRFGLFNWMSLSSANEFCASFTSPIPLLKRGAESIVEVSAKIKPLSNEWSNGTKIRVTLIQDEHYLYAMGEQSMTPLRPKNTVAAGGNITYSGVLSSNEHTAVAP